MVLARFLHVAGVTVLVGGQLVLIAAVVPAARRAELGVDFMKSVGKRYAVLTGVALVLVIASGAYMAGELSLWSDSLLQVKLMLLVLLGLLIALHANAPQARILTAATTGLALVIVWLGIKLTYG